MEKGICQHCKHYGHACIGRTGKEDCGQFEPEEGGGKKSVKARWKGVL